MNKIRLTIRKLGFQHQLNRIRLYKSWLVVQCAHLEKYEDFVNGFRMTSHMAVCQNQ